MQQRAIITSASNKFFPSLINLLGSIKANYKDHPNIYVYDLGLFWSFRKELERIPKVYVLDVANFVPFWRSCYTWKTYIFSDPKAISNFYLDAGCQVLKSLDEIFEVIEKDGYFAIDQGVILEKIVPSDYWQKFSLNPDFKNETSIHAGEFGFKYNPEINEILNQVFVWAKQGYTLGFSKKDFWRDKGKDRCGITRDCEIFRHDMTLLNIAMRKHFGTNLKVNSLERYAGGKDAAMDQLIWHLRLSFKGLDYVKSFYLHSDKSLIVVVNRLVIRLVLALKALNLYFKKVLGIIK